MLTVWLYVILQIGSKLFTMKRCKTTMCKLDIIRNRFNRLDSVSREEILRSRGTHLHTIYTDHYRVDLYTMDMQFVEVWTNRAFRKVECIYIPTYKEMSLHIVDVTMELNKVR